MVGLKLKIRNHEKKCLHYFPTINVHKCVITYMNKLKYIYKLTTSPIIKKLIKDGDELSAWQTIYGGYEDKDILRIIYVSEDELYGLSKGVKKSYHNNGQLWMEYSVNKDGMKDGLYRRWLSDGRLCEKFTYKNGRLIK